jgi:uncharacterized small protein (DUF1192 family)
MTIHPEASVDECMEEISALEAEIERLTRERDEWKAKWVALAQASLIVGALEPKP